MVQAVAFEKGIGSDITTTTATTTTSPTALLRSSYTSLRGLSLADVHHSVRVGGGGGATKTRTTATAPACATHHVAQTVQQESAVAGVLPGPQPPRYGEVECPRLVPVGVPVLFPVAPCLRIAESLSAGGEEQEHDSGFCRL